MGIPIHDQFFVERKRNNAYSWGMFGALCGLFILYGIGMHWLPRFIRRRRERFPRTHKVYVKALRLWSLLNTTFRARAPLLGTFYIQTSMLAVLFIYIVWLILMSWCGTSDINYEPRYYIVGKKVGKVAVGNMPLLLMFIMKNDVMTFVTGWPAHYLTFLHIWMGRVIYFMIVLHVILTTSYWISLHFMIMIVIPPQIIGMIAFASMSLLTLLSTGFIRRLSYEFFLFNHGFFSFLMLLGGFLHNDGSKAGIMVAVHALVLDRMVKQVRTWINYWCMKPDQHLATYTVLDPHTIQITLPITNKDVTMGGKVLHTFGNWAPGQHIYIKVPSVGRFEWHPYTIASISSSHEMLIIMKVYRGFTKRLLKAVTTECERLETASCQLVTWFHGTYGATIPPLADFDTALFVAGGTGASFTFPVALDLMERMANPAIKVRCRRVRFVWYIRSRDSLDWYESIILAMEDILRNSPVGMISLEIYLTSQIMADDSRDSEDVDALAAADVEAEKPENKSISASSFKIESRKPKIYNLVEEEITQQCNILGEDASKEIAVLACGPSALVNDVAFESERQERRNKRLHVYRYMEKYVV